MKNTTMGIYKLENRTNGKVYIGSTKNFHKRELRHKSELRNGRHFNVALRDDYLKYGDDSFRFEILEVINDKNLIRNKEMYWINKYKSIDREFGYNNMPTIVGEASSRDFKQKSEGERNKGATIKAKDVINICKRLNNKESVASIMKIYDVAQETIYRILRGNRWRDLGEVYLSEEILAKWKTKPDRKGMHPDTISYEVLQEICSGINQGVSDAELAALHRLSAAGISTIRKGGCRSSETVHLLNDKVLSLWTYNIHLVDSLIPKRKPKENILDKMHGNQALTNTQVIEICEKLNQGLFPKDIAKNYGISSETVYRIRKGDYYGKISNQHLNSEIKENRKTKAKRANQLSDSVVIEICNLLNQGVPIRAIATQVGVVKSTIYRIRNRETNREVVERHLKQPPTI